jgi:hypothetical protein
MAQNSRPVMPAHAGIHDLPSRHCMTPAINPLLRFLSRTKKKMEPQMNANERRSLHGGLVRTSNRSPCGSDAAANSDFIGVYLRSSAAKKSFLAAPSAPVHRT